MNFVLKHLPLFPESPDAVTNSPAHVIQGESVEQDAEGKNLCSEIDFTSVAV